MRNQLPPKEEQRVKSLGIVQRDVTTPQQKQKWDPEWHQSALITSPLFPELPV